MKILIIRLSSLGDIILTQPICALLHESYPDAELHYLCKPEFAALVAHFGLPITIVHYYKSLAWNLSLLSKRYDLVVDLHGKFSSILAAFLVKAKSRSRYAKQRSLRKAIVAHTTESSIDSTVSLYHSALRKIGIRTAWHNPVLYPDRPPESTQPHTTRIACFPGANHYTKRWPVANWRELIGSMPEISFTLMGGGGDITLAKEICSGEFSNCKDLTGNFSIAELINELPAYDLILSGDTGPMHLAAALALPQIAIFGGTHPRLGFKPLNSKAEILCADLGCQPCSLHGLKDCPLGHFKCMELIKPDDVAKRVRELLR